MIDPQDLRALMAAIVVGLSAALLARTLILPLVLGLFARRP